MPRIRADRHKSGVSDRKLSGKAVDQIERCRQNDVNADKHEKPAVIIVKPIPKNPVSLSIAFNDVKNAKMTIAPIKLFIQEDIYFSVIVDSAS